MSELLGEEKKVGAISINVADGAAFKIMMKCWSIFTRNIWPMGL